MYNNKIIEKILVFLRLYYNYITVILQLNKNY